MSGYFLGVDIGGTKSHAMIADADGRVLGFGHAGAGNHESVGLEGLDLALRGAVGQALAEARLSIGQIAGMGVGMGGYDWPSQHQPLCERMRRALGLDAPLELVNDAVIGLVAGASEPWGVAVVAGTSNNCRGRDRHGREGRVTGEGPRFDEYGGAGELVARAVQAVSRAWSRRGPPTALTEALVGYAGAGDVFDLLEGLAVGRLHVGPGAAPLVFAAARGGDAVAQAVIAWAGQQLADLACGVIRQLDMQQEAFDVVMVGSLFNGGELLIDPMRQDILALAPRARLVRLDAPPVVGGVLLGMMQAGADPAHAHAALARGAIARVRSATQALA